MRVKIYNSKNKEFFDVEGETFEEIREKTLAKEKELDWQPDDCWSKQITPTGPLIVKRKENER